MSEIFDSIEVSDDIKRYIDHSFDVVDQIHEILESQGKTQRDLATMLGKKESEISKWMRGTHNFTLKSISKIESALGESIILTPAKAKRLSATRMVVVAATINRKSSYQVHESANWREKVDVSVYKRGLKTA